MPRPVDQEAAMAALERYRRQKRRMAAARRLGCLLPALLLLPLLLLVAPLAAADGLVEWVTRCRYCGQEPCACVDPLFDDGLGEERQLEQAHYPDPLD